MPLLVLSSPESGLLSFWDLDVEPVEVADDDADGTLMSLSEFDVFDKKLYDQGKPEYKW